MVSESHSMTLFLKGFSGFMCAWNRALPFAGHPVRRVSAHAPISFRPARYAAGIADRGKFAFGVVDFFESFLQRVCAGMKQQRAPQGPF